MVAVLFIMQLKISSFRLGVDLYRLLYIYFPLSRLIIECKNGISENIETKSKSHKQWDITEGPGRRADVLVRNK